MTAGCEDPSPNPHTGRGLLFFPFPLNFLSRLELRFPRARTELGRWDAGGCSIHNPPPTAALPPPWAQPIHPAAPGFGASLWSVCLLHHDGSWEFWFCRAPGHATPRGRGGEVLLPGPGKHRASGRVSVAGGGPGGGPPACPRDSARPGGGRGGVAIPELKKTRPSCGERKFLISQKCVAEPV